MKAGTFIWADLSTFRLAATQAFYASVLGWRNEDYTAYTANGPVAGIYEMPAKFQKMGMPSFWMSYIAVNDVALTVELTKQKGGKVELGPAPFVGGGQFALIRDPLGAGFTVYQGTSLGGSNTKARIGHGLFVSDAGAVRGFYTHLFGWEFGASFGGVQSILLDGHRIAHLHEIPDIALRGKEEYWAVVFASGDLVVAAHQIDANGGTVLTETQLPEGPALLAHDPDGCTFFLVQQP